MSNAQINVHSKPSVAAPVIPASAWRLIALEFWERFSYYGILAILVLFLTHPITRGGFGWTDSQALSLLSMFTGLAFILPMAGGYVADRWLGARRSVFIGSCLLLCGNIGLAASAATAAWSHAARTAGAAEPLLYIGLTAIAVGNGLFKSSLVTLLGSLIVGDDAARDRAFRYYYQAIMLGALVAALCVGSMAETVGWWSGFTLAAAGMAVAWVIFVVGPRPVVPVAGKAAAQTFSGRADSRETPVATRVVLDVAILCFFLLIITVGWVQFQGLWLLEVDRWVDRKVGGFTMPTSWLLAVNAIAIVILTPLSGRLWRGLTVPGRPVAGFAMQFAVAFAIIGVAQLLMGLGFRAPTPGGVSFWWPVGCLLIITIAESLFWPSSYNAIHRITPARSKSLVMGIWLAMLGIGQYVTHQIARTADFLGFSQLCFYIGVSMLIACAALVIVARLRSSLRTL